MALICTPPPARVDLLLETGAGDCAALNLLDISTAFQRVDHTVSVLCFEENKPSCTFWKIVPPIFPSYWVSDMFSWSINGRFTSVFTGNRSSFIVGFTHGVPQGSILGPTIFAPVVKISLFGWYQSLNSLDFSYSVIHFLVYVSSLT